MMFMVVEMDIKKVREAFEKLPEIRDSLSEHIVFIGSKYTTPNPDFYDLVNWLNGAWYAWQAKAQAVPEGFVLVPTKNIKYFSNDGENYEIHNTLAEAKHEAECAIEHFSERLADQLSDPRSDGNFNDVGYGIVLAQSAYSIDHIVTQDDIDNGDYSYEVGTEIMSLFLVEAQEQSHD